jgi:hypothetical protein
MTVAMPALAGTSLFDLLGNVAIVGVFAGVLSALTYRCLELPALRHKRSTRSSPAPAASPLTSDP